MTRKRYIKLLMATGDFDRNLANSQAQLVSDAKGYYSYSQQYEAYNYVWEIMAGVQLVVEKARKRIELRNVAREEWKKYRAMYTYFSENSIKEI